MSGLIPMVLPDYGEAFLSWGGLLGALICLLGFICWVWRNKE